ncbi:hypothetical protein [Halorussus amylolyticus]|uniref:hypothetical protein n=1 Tax=Halorussus amylolyticus TaxID=1126242 RepID=UPI00138EFFC6|nr:hypothetical protein [Halorussus amylolyticus]
MVPLFGPVPGGLELIIIFFVVVLMFGLPLALLGGGFFVYQRSKPEAPADDELRALRREVEALREEIERLDDDENE